MNARLALRIASFRRANGAAAVPACPESLRARHIWRGHELVSDGDDMPPHIAPVVLCDRSLPGWTLIPRTLIRGVIR